MNFKLYHNPRCSKSRQTKALLDDRDIEYSTVLYLENPPSAQKLANIIEKLNIDARTLMRKKEAEYTQLDLNSSHLSEEALIQAMVEHPKLIERPIVVTDQQAAIGRPPEQVLEILA